MQIVPEILSHSFEEVTTNLSRLDGLSTLVQIDLCDGIFGREKSWLPEGNEKLPSDFFYEFDLMIDDWRTYLPRCVALGAKRIVAHVDTFRSKDMEEFIGMINGHSIELGISVSNDKTVDFHADKVRQAREIYPHVFIQIMGVKKVGEQGQFFDEDTIERIKYLKSQFGDLAIQVDGGLKPDTLKRVGQAGMETAIVGSYIFGHEDATSALENLNKAISEVDVLNVSY